MPVIPWSQSPRPQSGLRGPVYSRPLAAFPSRAPGLPCWSTTCLCCSGTCVAHTDLRTSAPARKLRSVPAVLAPSSTSSCFYFGVSAAPSLPSHVQFSTVPIRRSHPPSSLKFASLGHCLGIQEISNSTSCLFSSPVRTETPCKRSGVD